MLNILLYHGNYLIRNDQLNSDIMTQEISKNFESVPQ